MKRIAAILLTLMMLLVLFAGCSEETAPNGGPSAAPTDASHTGAPSVTDAPTPGIEVTPDPDAGTAYTYSVACPELPQSWDPLTADEYGRRIYSLLSTPLFYVQPTDLEKAVSVMLPGLAEGVEDVTGMFRDELLSAGVDLHGLSLSEITEGYIFDITLRSDAVWENGENVTSADIVSAVEAALTPGSGKQAALPLLLNKVLLNGANEYYGYRSEPIFTSITDLGYSSNAEAEAGESLYIDMWEFWGLEGAQDATGNPCPRYVRRDSTVKYSLSSPLMTEPVSAAELWAEYSELFDVGAEYASLCGTLDWSGIKEPVFEETVGCIALDESTLRFICASPVTVEDIMEFASSIPVVYSGYLKAAGIEDEEGTPRGFCTGIENTMSCGPYRLETADGERLVLTRNPRWFGWHVDYDGSPIAFTDLLINGERLERYKTTRITVEKMTESEAAAAFDAGLLCERIPSREELEELLSSESLCISPSRITTCLCFNMDPSKLRTLDVSSRNKNASVLSNYNFRRAVSLSIDREAWCAISGGAPCLGLIGDAYGAAAGSSYRYSEDAMRMICDMYGVEYGEGAEQATLEQAFNSIDGYSPELAHELFSLAADELIEEGLYSKGKSVVICVACPGSRLTKEYSGLIELLNRAVGNASRSTGFASNIRFEAVACGGDPAEAVAAGSYAVGIISLGGDEVGLYGFMRQLLDSELYELPKAFGYELLKEPLSANVGGEDIVLTRREWSRALSGEGRLASADDELKVRMLAMLEGDVLGKYCVIPLTNVYKAVLLSEKVQFITRDYSPSYGRGGFELMVYNYSDEEWAQLLPEPTPEP